MEKFKYIVVTPTKNEEKYIEKTIISMLNQRIKPIKWIIVDDCSTDRTAEIVSSYCEKYDWIELYHLNRNKGRRPGSGVIEAFEFGLHQVKNVDYDYIAKLDSDVMFDSDFFAKILTAFKQDTNLGICSGAWHDLVGEKPVLKPMFSKHTAGQTKVYRRDCYEDIGGLIHFKGWDLYDNICANVRGWESKWLPDARHIHLRPEGIEKGRITEEFNIGRYEGRLRYSLFFAAAKAFKRMMAQPYIIAGLAQIFGCLYGILFMHCIGTKEERKYLRSQQYQRMNQSLNYVKSKLKFIRN